MGFYSLDKAIELAHRALTLDASLAEAYALLGSVHFLKKNYDPSIRQLQRAGALEPGAAVWPDACAAILTQDAAVFAAGAAYLVLVAPFYAFFGDRPVWVLWRDRRSGDYAA